MKVCILQYNASEYLTRVDRSARALVADGHDVVLVAVRDDRTPAFEDRDGYTVKRVAIASRRLPRRFGLRLFRFIEGIWRTFAQAYREDADVYNPRDAEPLLAAHAAALLRRSLVVYDSDELCLYRNKPVARRRLWRWAMRRYEGFFIRRSAAAVTSDHGRADIIAETYRVPRPTVVRNVPERMDTIVPDHAFRAAASGDCRYLLIYQGIFVPNRGLPELIAAMRGLPDCALALVGYGHIQDELEGIVSQEGLGARVRLFEAVPFATLMGYTAASDVGVIPLIGSCLSYVHAAPNKLFEFMMAGIPVVVSDLPEMARVVREERVGTLIEDPSDPASIALAVQDVLQMDEPLAEMGARARDAALARYVWETDREAYLDVFRELTIPARRERRA